MKRRVYAPSFASVLLAAVTFAILAFFVMPTSSYAREYSIDQVDIDATVSSDGALRVVETRTFNFDGSFNGVYWDIPTGHNSTNGKDVSVSVLEAGEGDVSEISDFVESDSGSNGSYEVSDYGNVLRLKIYSRHEDEKAKFTIAYEARGITTRWDDVSELYWKFVSDGWDVESRNVTCTLHLPVPASESVTPGDNVRAWGHGPLDATVAFDGNDVVFAVPGVGTDEFAEMRIAFPTTWLADCETTPGNALSSILDEEQQWADEANAKRQRARLGMGIAYGVLVLLGIGTVLATFFIRRSYKERTRPQFQDDYFRDVPTSDHPAVLGALYNGGEVEGKDLTATLMRLTDAGEIKLDKVKLRKQGFLGEKVSEDYRITRLASVAPSSSFAENPKAEKIDDRTLKFLFRDVADSDNAPGSELYFRQFEKAAKEDAEGYDRAWNKWAGTVSAQYEDRFGGNGKGGSGKGLLIALGVLDCVAAVVALLVLLIVLEAPLLPAIGLPVALAIVAAIAFVFAAGMKDLNAEGIEVKARLEALRRWLKEFTRLGEAVPEDVVLWNRLLVMAVVLGVAEEVIEQLKVAMPQILDDPTFMPCYGWYGYGYGPGHHRPFDAFEKSLDSAHHVSAAALAASSDSSGGGGGGGFSGGGGGGFGGGGGGGAF